MKSNLPVLILRNMVLFPYSEIRLEFESEIDRKLLSLAESYYENHILVVNPQDNLEIDPEIEELPPYGIIATIKMKLDMPNGKVRIIIQGDNRAKVHTYAKDDGLYEALISTVTPEELTVKEELAYVRSLTKHIEYYVKEVPTMSNTVLSQIAGISSINKLTDIIAVFLPIDIERKMEYISEISSTCRVKMILDDINHDVEVLKLEKEIESSVAKGLEDSQKEFVLREKINAIKEELGEDKDSEVNTLRESINCLGCNEKVKSRLLIELNRYATSNPTSPEVSTIRNYIDWLITLPWSKETTDRKDLKKVRAILDSTHSGLNEVKDRIIEYLAVKENTNNLRSPIICLVGPPGVGKTSFAKSVAEAVSRNVTKISVGGVNDEAEIIGHRRTYIGSAPGLIIQGMKKAGTINPVFIIDEIDKMTKDIKGDPASSLLEVLDKEQNTNFIDHYIEEAYDLSKVFFIATANYIEQIPAELKDRLEIIELSSYTEYEKIEIAKKHLIPNQLSEHGLTSNKVKFSDDAIITLIRNYTKEAGVRELDRVIATVIRKIVKEIVVDKSKDNYNITGKNIEKYLGINKYIHNNDRLIDKPGITNGLAYTLYGGDILKVEVATFKGRGDFILTGSLGEVMQESARIAYDYMRANSNLFKISEDVFTANDIHIHIPDGSSPKEGPSAGVALLTALISLFTNKIMPSNVAMTGELTLTGKVKAVGGLKEKIIGASRCGIEKIFIPRENEKDLKEIEENIKRNIEFILVEDYMEIYNSLKGEKNGKGTKDH